MALALTTPGIVLQLLDAVAHDLLDRFRLVELRALQRHLQRQHVVRVESGIDAAERHRRADEQRRSDQQHQRQRHFDDDQDRAHLVLPEAGARPSAAFLQRRRQIGLRALQRRNQSEDDAGRQRHGDREGDDAPVEARRAAPFSPTRGSPAVLTDEQRADAGPAHEQPEHAAGEREDDAFGQQLPDDAAARSADGGADRDLAPAAGRAHQQQVGDVGARDQQHEADGAAVDQQRRS